PRRRAAPLCPSSLRTGWRGTARRRRSPARHPGPTPERSRARSPLPGVRTVRRSCSTRREITVQPLLEGDRQNAEHRRDGVRGGGAALDQHLKLIARERRRGTEQIEHSGGRARERERYVYERPGMAGRDRKSTRLNSSHVAISYAV